MGKMTGNEFLVKALQEEGVEKIFGYPGACVIDDILMKSISRIK